MTASYVLLITIFLSEGGMLEAEADTPAMSYQECRQMAGKHEQSLKKEFALTRQEEGSCPFKDVQVRCLKVEDKD